MLFKRVHPVIPCRSKTYIKVPSRGVWKVCKGLTTLASSLYYSALSLLLHFPPFWGRRGCCYCSLLSHSGCSPRGGRAVLLFEKERSFFPPSSNSLTLFHAHTHPGALPLQQPQKEKAAASDISLFFCSHLSFSRNSFMTQKARKKVGTVFVMLYAF